MLPKTRPDREQDKFKWTAQRTAVKVAIVEDTSGLITSESVLVDHRQISALAVDALSSVSFAIGKLTQRSTLNVSCDNRAKVELKLNGVTQQVLRASLMEFNLQFNIETNLEVGDNLTVEVTNKGATVSDFDLTFYGVSVE